MAKNNDSSIEFQIGNQGMGEATIREGGLVTAENTIIGGNATGVGTLNVQDQDSVITVRRLYNGYFGNGAVNISNNGLINNKEYSLVGVEDGSHGVVNVTDKGHWSFLGTGEAFRYIYIGDAGDGELNVSREGKVDSGIITAGMKETGTGNITVKDKNSVITNLGTNLGYDGHGEMNISNEGLVVSNGGSSLGYGENGVGNVSITTGGMWEVNKNVYTTIGVAGVGNLNISDGGKFVSQNITFLGDKASGIGTLNLMDGTSSFDTVGINVGNFGSGIVNVSNGATLNESDGGPGIARIMAFLMGSSEALRDRYDFIKFQVFKWLIGATDGHAKNFSVFIQAGGSYRLTPFYDIISAFPVPGGTGIHISDLKLAMGLNASKGKKTAIDKIYPRHFLATAKVLRFPEVQMHEILSDFARMIPAALDNVKTSLPTDFPENVVTAVETNVLRLHGRLSREYGSK